MKKCSICKIVKSDNSFYKHMYNKDGLYDECKACINYRYGEPTKRKEVNNLYQLNVSLNLCYLLSESALDEINDYFKDMTTDERESINNTIVNGFIENVELKIECTKEDEYFVYNVEEKEC